MEFVIFVIILVVLDVAAMRWGVDSRDSINGPVWARRQSAWVLRAPAHRA